MKYKSLSIEEAIKQLQKEYEKAKRNPVVRDPVAYSLYQVWKTADEKEYQIKNG